MRILHISKYYYPFSGGTEQIARDIVLSLRSGEYEQEVFCFAHNNHMKDSVDEDQIDGIKVIRCKCFAKIFSQSISFFYGKQLYKEINSYKPDIIIFHYPNPFAAHFLLKFIKNDTKLIVYWHLDIVKQKFIKSFFNGQNRNLIARADKIVATSPLYIQSSEWLSNFKNKCVVVPNCIDENRLHVNEEIKYKSIKIKEKDFGKIICVAVGRHVEYKGFRYLIEASEFLDDRFVIYILGQGPLTNQLMELSKNDSKIHFLGLLPDDDLISYLAACDIFCFPSITKNEAFGLALAEGMYFGKPAVTFTIPGSGVNYVSLNNITGIECPNRNSKAYADALLKLGNSSLLREQYGVAAKKRVDENFTFKKFQKNIIELLNSINI